MRDDIYARSESFAREHLTWIAVRHFLSADLLQELSQATIDLLTEGNVSLDDLFETARTDALPELMSWFAYPRETTGPKDGLLQDLVRFLVWNSDYAIWSPAKDASPREAEMLNGIRTAFNFASLDLGTIAQHREVRSFPEPLSEFVDAISSLAAATSASTADEVVTILTPVASRFEAPLNAIILKHLGDLCADADRWRHATEAYSYAARILPEARGAWSDLIRVLRGIIQQSQVAAIWMLEGADEAMPAYGRLIRQGSLSSNPLPLFNAMTDALNASFSTKKQDSLPDRRVVQGVAPLLLDTLDLDSALTNWRREQHDEAHKAFWATLRRQTALGSISASRSTKALYGECLIEHVRRRQDRHSDRSLFQLGLRLLIESGHDKTVDRIEWPERLVAEYVDLNLVADALRQTRSAPGIADERSCVVLTLLKCWVLTLPRGLTELARTMLETLAQAAAEIDGSDVTYRKSTTVALEGLSMIARKRPEFIPLAAGSIAGAIVAQLEKAALLDAGDAVTLAILMVESFDEDTLLTLISATLNRLAMFEPSRSPWPIVRPAISFLSSRRILELCRYYPKLQRDIPTTIVTFALESETEYASLLYLLRDIDPVWINKDAVAPRIGEVIAQLRKRAHETRSSRAAEDIAALLVAPAFSGSAGVSDALDALCAIVQTAADGRPTLSFDSSWRPLMIATDNLDVIVRDTELSAEDLAGRLNAIATALMGVWNKAGAVPLIFAGFAIPRRTAPSAVIVHNWTFASVGLGRLLGREAEMAQALEIAARQPALQGPIALAKAVRFAAGDQSSLDATSIREEEKDAFYAALGKRLLMLSDLPADIRTEITSVLFEQCLRLGPSGLDAGVFVVAVDQDFDRAPLAPDVRAYRRRLDNDSGLRVSLTSLLEAVVPRGATTEL